MPEVRRSSHQAEWIGRTAGVDVWRAHLRDPCLDLRPISSYVEGGCQLPPDSRAVIRPPARLDST